MIRYERERLMTVIPGRVLELLQTAMKDDPKGAPHKLRCIALCESSCTSTGYESGHATSDNSISFDRYMY